MPVLLVLHNPDSGIAYWADVRQALRNPGAEKAFVEVPEDNRLNGTDAIALFETAGVQDQPFIEDLDGVLARLLAAQSTNASFPLSHFDLFAHGLTNICRSIYYGMDLVSNRRTQRQSTASLVCKASAELASKSCACEPNRER
ncbi:MAG: DUF4365 domain-containing protein [Azonexus sp.]